MRPISQKVRRQINDDPGYRVCMLTAHPGHICGGRLTREHAVIHAGKQVDAKWAIISACARGQEVDQFQDAGTMDKRLNIWVALNRATDEELLAVSKAVDYVRLRRYLNSIYGEYVAPEPMGATAINYGF